MHRVSTAIFRVGRRAFSNVAQASDGWHRPRHVHGLMEGVGFVAVYNASVCSRATACRTPWGLPGAPRFAQTWGHAGFLSLLTVKRLSSRQVHREGPKVVGPASTLLVLWSPEARSLGEEAELASWGFGVGTEAVPVHPVHSCPAPLPTSWEPLGATCPQTDAPGRSSQPPASIHAVTATRTCCPASGQASVFRPLLQNTWTRPRAVLLMGPAASEGFPCRPLPFPVSCTTCTRYEGTVCMITSTRGCVPVRPRKHVHTYVCSHVNGDTG